MMFKRVMGKASFCNIQDLEGRIQVYVAKDAIGEDAYADFKKSDIGDIYGILYRLTRGDVTGIVVAVLQFVTGNFFGIFWVIDLITIITKKEVTVLA